MSVRAPRFGPVARTVLETVRAEPGIHFRRLARRAQVASVGQLRHHLDRLGRLGLVVQVSDGRYRRIFAVGAYDPRLRPRLARLARAKPRLIGTLLLEGPLNRTQLRQRLACSDATLGYHLKRMVEDGDLLRRPAKNSCLYALVAPEQVRPFLLGSAAARSAPLRVRESRPSGRSSPWAAAGSEAPEKRHVLTSVTGQVRPSDA